MIPEDNLDMRWKIFASKSIPKDFSPAQSGLMEFAFMAGAMNLFDLLQEWKLDETKKNGILHMKNLYQGAFTALQILFFGEKKDKEHEVIIQPEQPKEEGQFMLPLESSEPSTPKEPEPPKDQSEPEELK